MVKIKIYFKIKIIIKNLWNSEKKLNVQIIVLKII